MHIKGTSLWDRGAQTWTQCWARGIWRRTCKTSSSLYETTQGPKKVTQMIPFQSLFYNIWAAKKHSLFWWLVHYHGLFTCYFHQDDDAMKRLEALKFKFSTIKAATNNFLMPISLERVDLVDFEVAGNDSNLLMIFKWLVILSLW